MFLGGGEKDPPAVIPFPVAIPSYCIIKKKCFKKYSLCNTEL